MQLWKSYEDEMSIYIENPSGNRIGPLDEKLGPQRYRLGNTELLIYYGKPGPYHLTQEIYIDFLPVETYVDSGDWKIILSGKKVSGAAALLMQWGIVNGNDPYLYGEKVKAYLRKGARPLPGYEEYPNEEVGWGDYVLQKVFHYS